MTQGSATMVQELQAAEMTAHYPIMNIVKCMRISAMMLEIADSDNPKYSKLNLMQANLLRAAAKDLASQYEAQLTEIKKIAESFLAGPSVMDERTSAMVREFFEKEHDEPGSL